MSDFTWHGDAVMARLIQASEHALKTVGQDLKGKSQTEAPIDIGDLRGNCHVTDTQDDNNGLYVQVGYSLPYARRQHEHTEYRHLQGGKAKFLEDPFKENKTRYERYIRSKVAQALR